MNDNRTQDSPAVETTETARATRKPKSQVVSTVLVVRTRLKVGGRPSPCAILIDTGE